MHKQLHSIFAFLLFFSGLTAHLRAADDLEAGLIVTGPGDPIYSYWGHIGFSINNKTTGEDLFYDFGNFSFYSDHFYRDFAMGRMVYLVDVKPTSSYLAHAMSQNRYLKVYPLNLGESEVQELDTTLKWWARPENSEYLYEYFRNNCSTIVRDILSDVTDGALKDATQDPAGGSFRHYARTGAHESAASELLLHFLLGAAQDPVISRWDKMFLPQALADIAQETEYTGRDGINRTLADSEIVLQKAERPPVPQNSRTLWPFALITGVLTGGLWIQAASAQSRAGVRAGKIFRTVIVLAVALPGLLLSFMSIFTNHMAAHNNQNVWIFLPTILFCLIPLNIRQSPVNSAASLYERYSGKRRREWWITRIVSLNTAGVVLSLIVSVFTGQDSAVFQAFFAPFTGIVTYFGIKRFRTVV